MNLLASADRVLHYYELNIFRHLHENIDICMYILVCMYWYTIDRHLMLRSELLDFYVTRFYFTHLIIINNFHATNEMRS